ncbi:TPA: asparaginase [Candidatus Nomurabacteria bacterium]|nr:asparaginase [Candidatus Nomurabacteria bacterium]
MKENKIHFIITGGTIDSYYETTKDTVVPNKLSCIPDYIKSLKLHVKTSFKVICMKDSRDISKKDRQIVVKEILNSKSKNFIITHGTYTMGETAKFIVLQLQKNNDKKILLTGSMIPLIGFSPTDAGFNLGFAMAAVGNLLPGVYVAMNGRVFAAEEVIKLVSEGRFVSIFNQK